MNLYSIMDRFSTQEACLNHLEDVRWNGKPTCPHCGSERVGQRSEKDRIGRWNCHACHASFNVLAGTIFQGTHIPLKKWFVAIGLMLHAKKSLSSCQLARDLALNQKTAWYMQQRIRSEMASKQQAIILKGIIGVFLNGCFA